MTALNFLKISVVILVIFGAQGIHGRNTGGGGYEANEYTQSKKCPDATCQSPPRGVWCDATYNIKEDDGCCPEWKCRNGQTVYGIRYKTSNWNSWKSKWDAEWASKFPSGGSSGQWGNWIDNDNDKLFSRDPIFDRYVGRRR